jgi:HlyD family secretion protein
MSAQVEIFTEREENVLTVPLQAVTVRKISQDDDAEPAEVVFALRDKQFAQLKPVVTGISDSKYIVVKEGLREGEQIVTGPYRMLSKEMTDSMKVKILESLDKEDANQDAAAPSGK